MPKRADDTALEHLVKQKLLEASYMCSGPEFRPQSPFFLRDMGIKELRLQGQLLAGAEGSR